MAEPGQHVIRIVARIDDVATIHDGQFVVEYDAHRGRGGGFKLVTSPDIGRALGFANAGEAFECWRRVCPNHRKRPDGKPDRPLTVYTVEMTEVGKESATHG